MKKTVFITGGTRGIGKAMVYEFVKRGYLVGFSYLNSDAAAKNIECELNPAKDGSTHNCIGYKCDARDLQQSADTLQAFTKITGRLDCLVANAGIDMYGQINDVTKECVEEIFSSDVYSVIFACKEAAKYMVSQKYGKIVTISSIWGITGSSCESLYSAAKGAVNAFTKSLAKELGQSNINVNAVAPGVVMTDMMKDFDYNNIQNLKDRSALNSVCQPEDIAKVVAFLCEDSSSTITGQIISPNCGILI